MPVQGPERTPFSDADAAIPAERAGVTYRTSEKERIEQRRAARLQVADRRVDGLATSEVLEIYLPFTNNRTLPKDAAMLRKDLQIPRRR